MAAATTQDILAKAGRSGWSVVSIRPEMVKNPMSPAEWKDDPGHQSAPYEPQVSTGQFIIQVEPPSGSGQAAQEIKVGSAVFKGKPYSAEDVNNFMDFARKYGQDPNLAPLWDANSLVAPDKAGPTPPAAKNVQTYTDSSGSLWERDDSTGTWNPAKGVPGGSKTSGRTAAEESLSQAQADAIRGKTPGEIDELAARGILTRAQAQAVKAKTPAEIDQMVASAANARASAAATAAKTPAEIADLQSRARQGDAAAAKTLQDMAFAAVPKYGEATPTSGPNQSITDPTTGEQTFRPNQNYQPTDPVLRAQQLQSQAKAKREDLQQQVLNGQVTQEDALGQWNDYWNTQVEPIRQEIQQAQKQTQLENQLKVNQDARGTDTLAGTAANDLLGHAQQGAATGAGLLNTRMQQASGMMNNVLGIGTGSKNFGIGAGGAPDVSGLPGAVGSYLTNMGGGQGVYDTAANLVRNIDPNNSSGFAAHAAAALSQVMDRAQQQAAGTYQYGGGMPQPKPVDSILNQTAYGGAFGTAPSSGTDPASVVHAAVSAALGNSTPYQGAQNPNVFGSGG